jgi:hypothetical protein
MTRLRSVDRSALALPLGARHFSFRLHLEAIQPVNRLCFDAAENQACVVAVVIEPNFRQINAEVGESGFGEVVAEFRFFAPTGSW